MPVLLEKLRRRLQEARGAFGYSVDKRVKTPFFEVREMNQRNKFMAKAINEIGKRYKPNCLAHIGGLSHFYPEVESVIPLQALISAKEIYVINLWEKGVQKYK